MRSYDINQLTNKQRYKLLTGLITPRPIALVTSISSNGTINAAPFSYFNIISSTPPTIVLGINRVKGEIKDTARNILDNREFVVHKIDEAILENANQTSASLPYGQSEIDLTSFTLIDSQKIKTPAIKQAAVRMEVILKDHLTLENEGTITTDVILGTVVMLYAEEAIVDDNDYVDYDRYEVIGRLAGTKYARLGKITSLDRPK